MTQVPFKNKRELLTYLLAEGNMVENVVTKEVAFIQPANGELNIDIDLNPAFEFAPYEAPKVLFQYVYFDEAENAWIQPQKLYSNDYEFCQKIRPKRFKRIEPGIEVQS